MGQQQLLLITLSAIIVGVSVLVGIQMFSENAVQANQDAVLQDMMTIASRAQDWYRKPVQMGGGGRDWTLLTGAAKPFDLLQLPETTANGTYQIAAGTAGGINITGKGTEDGDGDGTPVTVVITVDSASVSAASFTSR